mgnify:CR=1 FL=1
MIRDFFGCGAIRFSRNDRTYKFEVRSIKELRNTIVPHFKEYPLAGIKQMDFSAFEEICELVYNNHHLNRDYLAKIIKLAYRMNPSGKRKYKQEELLRMLDEVKR